MARILGEILIFGVGAAISPVPTLAAILILFGRRARSTGLAYLAGWVLGLGLISGLALLLARISWSAVMATLPPVPPALRLLVGLLLLLMAYRQWRTRPQPGEEPDLPRWLAGVESLTRIKAMGLALLLAAVNPKNLGLALAAILAITQANLATVWTALAVGLFLGLACLGVAIPIVYYLKAGQRAHTTLQEWKTWLVTNDNTVTMVVLLLLGTMLVGRGLGGLGS